ncbi:hypothetical protein D3C85_1276060 [compost metagenome]
MIITDPLFNPLQETLVWDAIFEANTVGSLILKTCVAVQLLVSVTVTVYVPAVSPEAVALFPPEGDHA